MWLLNNFTFLSWVFWFVWAGIFSYLHIIIGKLVYMQLQKNLLQDLPGGAHENPIRGWSVPFPLIINSVKVLSFLGQMKNVK